MSAYLLLLAGVFACSTSVIFIRLGETDPVFLSAYRLLVAVVFMLPMYLNARNRSGFRFADAVRISWMPAVFLALHFISWIAGARMTPSANSSLIVNMVPVAMPFLLFLFANERINRSEALGTAISISGFVFLAAADFSFSAAHAVGDGVVFVSMLLFAFYLLCGRLNRDLPSVYLYIVPVYLLSGLICLAVGLCGWILGWIEAPLGPAAGKEILLAVALGLIPTVFGHSLINWSFRRIRGQIVAILNLFQFVFAGLMAALLLAEQPQLSFYLASIMVVAGAVLVVVTHSQSVRRRS